MIVANESHPGYHNAHARGVAAILQIENSPLDLFGAVQFVRSGHPLVLNGAVQVNEPFYYLRMLLLYAKEQKSDHSRPVVYFLAPIHAIQPKP
jgi:hypothetical protein